MSHNSSSLNLQGSRVSLYGFSVSIPGPRVSLKLNGPRGHARLRGEPLSLLGEHTRLHGRVSPFRLKNLFAYKRNKANLDSFHMCFTISL
jgi:hypothetical protein